MTTEQQLYVPEEIKGWNWGAFLLNWIWGIGNNTWIALLTFVPFLGLVMPFVLGFKGNQWAWKNKKWNSIEHFKKTQRYWSIAGLIVFAVAIIMAVSIFISVITIIKHTEVYQFSLQSVKNSVEVKDALGEPLTPSFFISGEIKTTGSSGTADFTYRIKGPKDAGTIYVKANKELDRWIYQKIMIERSSDHKMLDLTPR